MLDSQLDTLVVWKAPDRALRNGLGNVKNGKTKTLPKKLALHYESLGLCDLVKSSGKPSKATKELEVDQAADDIN